MGQVSPSPALQLLLFGVSTETRHLAAQIAGCGLAAEPHNPFTAAWSEVT